MAVSSGSASRDKVSGQAKNNTKCEGGVRVDGGRIYDPQNGKTCHQCRQKTMHFGVTCKNPKKGKQCTINYCHKCLLNRYGENAEEVSQLHDWTCPKCKGICNCSVCMKKLGHRPTGILVHKAKENGFSSVSQMLEVKGHANFGHGNAKGSDVVLSPEKETVADKDESLVASPRKPGKENSFHENTDSRLTHQNMMPNFVEEITRNKKQGGEKELLNGNKVHKASLGKNCPKKHRVSEGAPIEEQKGEPDGECFEEKKMHATQCPKDNGFVARGGARIDFRKGKGGGDSNSAKNSFQISEVQKNGRSRVELAGKKILKVDVSEIDASNPTLHNSNYSSDNTEPGVSSVLEDNKTRSKPKEVIESSKTEMCEQKDQQFGVSIRLPQGTGSVTVAGIQLAPEDVGPALQFLEFCAAFREVLDMKKGQPESVIREITRGRSGRHAPYSSVAQIHIQLLSIIERDTAKGFSSLSTSGQNSWVQALGQCVAESEYKLEEIPSDMFVKGVGAYNMLCISGKLKLLSFLCDEVLCTTTLRGWIDSQNIKIVDTEKEAREKVLVAKNKEKLLKQKMLDEVAKAIIAKNGAPLSISEHEAILSEIRREASQAHSEMVEAMNLLPKKRQRSDAIRTEPIIVDDEGHAFWSLRGYKGGLNILLQDIGTLDVCQPDEKWFAYEAGQKEDVDKYISSLRTKRLRIRRTYLQASKC